MGRKYLSYKYRIWWDKTIKIFILFEQNECELFGLGFRTEFDIEHGCGIKIKVEDGNYNIVEIGTADIAFC